LKNVREISLALGVVLACSYAANIRAADPKSSDGPKLKYEEPKSLTGEIFAKNPQPEKLLFKMKRTVTRSGRTLDVVRDYTYPDGKLAAREHVIYDGDALVSFELEETQTGAKGSSTIRRDPQNPAKGSVDFEYAKGPDSNAKPKLSSETLDKDTLVGDMVGPFLADHWQKLLRGEKVKCRYIVVPRRETVGFVFVKESESSWRGRDVVIVRMEPSSRLLLALVDPLFFTLEKTRPHRVLQYVGRTTPKRESGVKWKDLDAVAVFDWK
jgi:hypothetical protein